MKRFALFLILVSVGHSFGGLKEASKRIDIAPYVPVIDKIMNIDHRIIGGNPITIERHPYQVAYVTIFRSLCGGFIVSEDYILTSAHCVKSLEPADIGLWAGSTFLGKGTIIPLAEIWMHPEYNNPRYDNDVAVFRTAAKIQFSNTIQPIPLAREGREMVAGTTIAVSGWGYTEVNVTEASYTLMGVTLPVVDHARCQESYPNVLTSSEFCAGNLAEGGQGTCHGDSGGAATQDGLAVGIVSYARSCARPNAPTVFANIAAKPIRDFIREKTGL